MSSADGQTPNSLLSIGLSNSRKLPFSATTGPPKGPVFLEFDGLGFASAYYLPGCLINGIVQKIRIEFNGDEIHARFLSILGDVNRSDSYIVEFVQFLLASQLSGVVFQDAIHLICKQIPHQSRISLGPRPPGS